MWADEENWLFNYKQIKFKISINNEETLEFSITMNFLFVYLINLIISVPACHENWEADKDNCVREWMEKFRLYDLWVNWRKMIW